MRFYTASDGRSLPSVTTILDATKSAESRARLDLHYATNPRALLNNAESRRRGNDIDSWAKAFLLRSGLPEIDGQFLPYCKLIQPLLEEWRAGAGLVMADQVVFHMQRGYAGTLDLALTVDGKFSIYEIKTKKFFYQPQIDEALLQTTAYGEALQAQGFVFSAVGVVWVSPTQMRHIRVDDPTELANLSSAWSKRLQAFPGATTEEIWCEPSLS